MTTEELAKKAKETADTMAARLVKAYVASVMRQPECYLRDDLPDEDDFFAWVEGYDWSPEE